MIRLFDVENGKVIPTEHCYIIKFLKDIIDNYPNNYIKIYSYLFYMSCPNPELNPFFDIEETDKEDIILEQIECDFSPEDDIIRKALKMCYKLYETPTSRAYAGIKSMLDRLAKYMETTEIEHGRDGNITALVNVAAKFDDIRQSFKGTLRDLEEEQNKVRGNQRLSYDQEL